MQAGTYFTYSANEFNKYVGQRVRVALKARKKKQRVYVGTFMAFDFKLNMVLTDVYRVIVNVSEEQRNDMEGVLIINGGSVISIMFEDEKKMQQWPTPVKGEAKKKKAAQSSLEETKKPPPEKQETTIPVRQSSKPIKLKRSWLNTKPSSAESPSVSTGSDPPASS